MLQVSELLVVGCVSGGYKGYGLAMMVDLFCGVLSGADSGPNVRQMADRNKPVNLVSTTCFELCYHTEKRLAVDILM